MLPGKAVEKILFTVIFIAVGFLLVRGARAITDYTLEMKLYQDFLTPWETALIALRHQTAIDSPSNVKGDPVGAMRALVDRMRAAGIDLPASNTQEPFIYRLGKFGRRSQRILLVYQENRVMLYGLAAETFDRLDLLIDGCLDPDSGDFQGSWGSDGISRIGFWKI